jgi:transposase
MGKQKRYPAEFKDEACRLVTEQGYTQQRAARQLGINPLTLKDWLEQRGLTGPVTDATIPDSDDPNVLKAQVRELQRRIVRLEAEKAILKRATAFFAREQLP